MRSVLQTTRADGGDLGISAEDLRQTGSNTTYGFALSCSQRASLFFPPWSPYLSSAEGSTRASVPAGEMNSRPRTSSSSVAACEVRRDAGRQPKAQTIIQRPAESALPGNNTSARVDGSSESRNRQGSSVLHVLRSVVERVRRCVPRYSARCCQGLPLPRAVADVRHFLDALYYEEICFLILRSCLAVAHTGVFLYSCIWEHLYETHVTIILLGILAGLTLLRILCQYQIVKALARLRWAWWQRAILPDFVKLLRSPLWQFQRILFLVSFSFYFVVLHLAYYGTATGMETTQATVLTRYLSLVILVFLSALGPHILMLAVVCTSLVVCWCAPAADIEQLLVEEPRAANRALPARLLQMMHEEQWTSPERDHRSSTSDRNNTSSKRSSDTTQSWNKQLQRQLSRCQKHFSAQTTGLSEVTQEGSGIRRSKCDRRIYETRGTDDSSEVNARIGFTCAICLTEFHEGDVVRRLPCSHVFHSACITRWLSSRATCPLRCYLNFCIGHINQSPFDASRPFRVLASQLLRQRRIRFLASLRQRDQRHVGHQRPAAQVYQRQTQHRDPAQGYPQHREHHQDVAEDLGEDHHDDSRQHSADALVAAAAADAGTAGAGSVSAVVETQELAEELRDTMLSTSLACEETKPVRVPQQRNGARDQQMKTVSSHSVETTSQGVGAVNAEGVRLEGVEHTVMLSCCKENAEILDDDADMNFSSRVAEVSLQHSRSPSVATKTLSNTVKQQISSVGMTRDACMSFPPGASIESTVVLSVSSAGGSSDDEFSETAVDSYERYTHVNPRARHSANGIFTST